MKGTIIKGIAGFYYVKTGQEIYQCKARGVFKKQGITPAVGDQVEVEPGRGDEDDGIIAKILERKNHFIRPPIANVDCFAVVIAAARPAPNYLIADKFLVMAEKSETEIVLCINKMDLADEETIQTLEEIYRPIYPVVHLSGNTGRGMEELRLRIEGKRTALAGPSGVGKSTLLNRLIPEAEAEIGDISAKTKRGRHTTRHCELFDLGGGTMIFDTPGFTSFEVLEAEAEELQFFYPEMEPFIGQCKYDNCRHLKEPGCGVRQAVNEGCIARLRYESYMGLMQELREKQKY